MEGDLQRTVGANVRAIRVARGLSQEDFADAVGVHRTYLGGIERGERNLTLRSLERIADWLDVAAVDLLADHVHVEHEPRLHRKAPGRTPAVRPRR